MMRLVLFLMLLSTVSAADFLVTAVAGEPDEEFVVRILDAATIEEARALIGATDNFRIVAGTIVKEPIDWNPGWSYYIDPDTVVFGDAFIEVCDAAATYVEANLDSAGGAFLPNDFWCPWGTRVLQELTTTGSTMPSDVPSDIPSDIPSPVPGNTGTPSVVPTIVPVPTATDEPPTFLVGPTSTVPSPTGPTSTPPSPTGPTSSGVGVLVWSTAVAVLLATVWGLGR